MIVLTYVCCNWDKVRDKKAKKFKRSCGAMYKGLDIKNGRKVLFQPISFLLRRFHLAILLIYFTNQTFMYQVM